MSNVEINEEEEFKSMNLVELNKKYWDYQEKGMQKESDKVLKYVKYHWPDMVEEVK